MLGWNNDFSCGKYNVALAMIGSFAFGAVALERILAVSAM